MKIPFSIRVTRGCCPIRTPSTSMCVIEIADLVVFIVRYCFPAWNSSSRNSRTSFKGVERGSVPRERHQHSHFLQAEEYVDSVEALQDFLRRSTTPSESPLALKASLKWARRPEGGVLVLPSGGSDSLVRVLCPGMVGVGLGSLLGSGEA